MVLSQRGGNQMYRKLTWQMVLCVALMLSSVADARADYWLGKTAWDAGRYAEGIEQWRRAAEKGDTLSMRQLGQVHKKGLGVVQDYVEAHMWFNLASSRGDAVALRERDALRGKMTSEQLALAQKRAREWGSSRKRLRVPPKLARKLKTGVPAGSSKAEAQRVMSRKLSKVAALVTKGDIIGLEKMLSARLVNVNVRDRDGRGWTGLMHAAEKGYVVMVPMLLEAGAGPNIRALNGATALFIAVRGRHPEIVGLLLEAGADLSIRGPRGINVMELAKSKRYTKILNMLQETERAKRDSKAFQQAKSSNTPQGYRKYLGAWCRRSEGKFCKEVRLRLDASMNSRISGKTFSGLNSRGHRQSYTFFPSGKLTGFLASAWTNSSCSGSWRITGGKINISCRSQWGKRHNISPELVGNTLVGSQRDEEGTWTFRLSVQLGKRPSEGTGNREEDTQTEDVGGEN